MRSTSEKIFIALFLPAVVGFYLIYKYPTWFVDEALVPDYFYWFGKSTGFWYATLYTAIVCGIAGWVVWRGKSPYNKTAEKPLSDYQQKKFLSIFFAQLIVFYLIPFYLPALLGSKPFWGDANLPPNKDAYVYVYNGFTSWSGFVYIFLVVPVSVWFFGKRYCTFFCACGNLAEAIGVTKWGNRWVTDHTPRGPTSQKMEVLQYVFLGFAVLFGLALFLHGWKIISAPSLLQSMRAFQDLAVDLIFGALIGVGAYPFLGTRIWCRYGCPLAGGMRLWGKFAKSRFQVTANSACQGLGLCSKQCPMGIDVASYAHAKGVPKRGSFGLNDTPCIGCGGCVDICPVKALSFQKILNPKELF